MELSPEWVVGFTDGEGCFHVSINKHPEMSVGYQVLPEFVIVQHERDIQVLYALKRFFGCGVVRRNNADRWCLRIRKLSCLEKVCEFFSRHPLKTKKRVDFIRFCRIIRKMKENKHLTPEGLLEIVDIALLMNTQNRDTLLHIKRDLEARVRYSPPPSES
ncbi:Homing endonuclease LAGLIDADG/HNH [Thermocrinis albus DSM 14484]|uniref:Homing endonuclease LAGLIDADG/HNH n=1 Tax=Thermocrinis albus (strain DSM 14484 / JCM 11386 / HI 11/12) TaxID=638303 RepID=D3SLA8_THEAH|nr:Homing endonuclease LAGLIDADG/HNH [Thermocrinis albus DSM 14484]